MKSIPNLNYPSPPAKFFPLPPKKATKQPRSVASWRARILSGVYHQKQWSYLRMPRPTWCFSSNDGGMEECFVGMMGWWNISHDLFLQWCGLDGWLVHNRSTVRRSSQFGLQRFGATVIWFFWREQWWSQISAPERANVFQEHDVDHRWSG